jgi:hypothetical protein
MKKNGVGRGLDCHSSTNRAQIRPIKRKKPKKKQFLKKRTKRGLILILKFEYI